jgi:hypothetical protein
MYLTKYLPSLHEFAILATDINFSKEEISFQKKMAIKIGYLSWDDYVKFMYNFICNIFDIDSIADEMAAEFNQTNKIIGSLPILINNHLNNDLENELQPIIDKVDSFPLEDKNRINQFQNKWVNLFIMLMLDKCKNDVAALELINAFQLDLNNQFTAINSNPSIENSLALTEAIQMPNTNAVIEKYIKPNYYFPLKRHQLKKLHDSLLDRGLIENNDDFEKTFELKIRPQNVKPTVWPKEKTKLFYLLYRLNDNKEYIDGESIDKIANQLFAFKKNITTNTMRTNFLKAFEKFEDAEYIKKKMFVISNIIEKLPN